MKAVLCKSYGPPESLVVEDIADPTPGPGEVVLSVKAASVNFPDVLIIENKYQVKPPLPFSPGCEAAGVVEQVHPDALVKPGDASAITGYGCSPRKWSSADRLVPPGRDGRRRRGVLFTHATSDHAVRDRGN
jgi:NADPH2:quinone reductase